MSPSDPNFGYDDTQYDDAEAEDFDPVAVARQVTRRRFLAGLALSSAAGYGAFWALNRPKDAVTAAPTTTRQSFGTVQRGTTPPLESTSTTVPEAEVVIEGLRPAPVDQRILVLVELEGGNDGASTVVPAGSGAYYDVRPNLAIPADQVLPIDDEVGLHPSLSGVHGRQLAIVEGVGPVNGSMSHFEMVARWHQGDIAGNNSMRTGFLARLADSLDTGTGAVGLSTNGHTPRFNNVTATTLSLTDFNQLRVLTNDDWIYPPFRSAVGSFAGGPMTTTMAESWDRLNSLADQLPNGLSEFDRDIPMIEGSRKLGMQLAMAAELIRSEIGIRVVHVQLTGFDTHKGHDYKQERLMGELDVAVAGFLDKMDTYGYAERVLVATSSEFGRRARENGNGLDHGAASTMLVWGPAVPGRYGEPLSFTNLDDRGNLATTVGFDSYLGTLAQEWLGVEAESVLPGSPELLGLIPEL